jgi:hypothetical protein
VELGQVGVSWLEESVVYGRKIVVYSRNIVDYGRKAHKLL